MAAGVVAIARRKWNAGELVERPAYPAEFNLYPAYDDGSRLIDTDATAWVAKRFLDALIQNKMIPDDSPEFIGRVVLHAPIKMTIPGEYTMSYLGVLSEL